MISAKMETTAEMGATEEGTLSFISSCSCYRRIILSCSYFAKKGCFFIQAWLHTQYCNASNTELILLRATRGAHNPNLQVVVTHASHACNQHSVGLELRMNGMHRTQFDHARLDFLTLVIWSRVFWPSVTWNLRKAHRWSKSVLTFDRCHSHSVTFGYY